MQYIKQEKRVKWKEIIGEIVSRSNEHPEKEVEGKINYLISSILKETYSPSYFNYIRKW